MEGQNWDSTLQSSVVKETEKRKVAKAKNWIRAPAPMRHGLPQLSFASWILHWWTSKLRRFGKVIVKVFFVLKSCIWVRTVLSYIITCTSSNDYPPTKITAFVITFSSPSNSLSKIERLYNWKKQKLLITHT